MQGDMILFRINSTLIYTNEEQESLRALNFSERTSQVDPQNITLNFKTKINGENNHERKDMRYRFLYTGALLRQQ